MLDRPAASWAGAVLALVTGCDEPPSYLVRWTLVEQADLEHPDPPPLSSVKQCAEVGVSKVRVTTKTQGGTIVDQREYSCFPGAFERGDAVEVPGLPAGEYVVEIEGLRRTGEIWDCADESETCVAFAESSVTIAEGSRPTVEVVLLEPPQCDDGIDNDLDGRVDSKDPACIIDATQAEGADAEVTNFSATVTFLDSEVVFPADVSVDALRLEVVGQTVDGEPVDELLAVVPASQLDTEQWPFRLPLLGRSFDPGNYVFSMVAEDQLGNPKTQAHTVEFVVPDNPYLKGQFDFTADMFLEPIVEPIAVTVALLLDPTDEVGSTCVLGGFTGATVERMWFRVTDEAGVPVDVGTLGLSGSALGGGSIVPVAEQDGWISFACPTSMVASSFASPLVWGFYQLEVEARIGDVACFTSEGPRDLAPLGQSGAQEFNLQRAVDMQGQPPAGCEECTQNSDCSPQVCEAGICKDVYP